MGLDVSFNLKEAYDAGLVVHDDRNGTHDEIIDALNNESCSQEYRDWLQEPRKVAVLPCCVPVFNIDLFEDRGAIRSNPYIKDFLDSNNINYTEA